ncbi:MAG: hypothetical protein ACR2KV_07835, partial [Solirubrobacteraceae bacterium]
PTPAPPAGTPAPTPKGSAPAAPGTAPATPGTTPSAPTGSTGGGPGAVAFRAPTVCVRRPFRIYVAGAPIRHVTFYVKGLRLGRVSQPDASGRYLLRIDPSGLRRGTTYTMFALVADLPQGSRTLRLPVLACP